MCGIFGAIGNINNIILKDIALQAAKRGPNAHGIAWLEDEAMNFKKGIGRINVNRIFDRVDTDCIIGHCRLSTSGTPKNIINNQPIVIEDIAVSHNGIVPNYLRIAKELKVELSTECDSEIICHLIASVGHMHAIDCICNPKALLILHNNNLIAYRSGQPLYHLEKGDCHYFCSRPFADAILLEENQVYEYRRMIK